MFHVFHEGGKRWTYHDLKEITLSPFVVVVVFFFALEDVALNCWIITGFL